jgi:ABC-type antimicrobial peptide transport system permease subunit
MTSTDEDLHLTVVGTVLFPVFDENAFNEGVAFHPDLAGDIALSDGFGRAIVGFAPGVSDEEGAAAVTAALPDSMTVYAFPRRPEDVENLARVAGVPSALAAFLVLVAVAAVAHALVTSVRRRARDLGIVRSLGFVRRDVMASVAVQSVTLVVVGVAFGVPLGVALGRVVWSAVAGGLGVPAVPQVPSLGLALVVIGAIGAAMVVAAWPARHAATRAPAHVLRAE